MSLIHAQIVRSDGFEYRARKWGAWRHGDALADLRFDLDALLITDAEDGFRQAGYEVLHGFSRVERKRVRRGDPHDGHHTTHHEVVEHWIATVVVYVKPSYLPPAVHRWAS